ncbi:MAG TPA: FAD-binding oxidoreductase [Pyrinomonadaceae bacterium]|nr:FAD-binding oxidoreductase [Pyrinomonadaceae bacterium]
MSETADVVIVGGGVVGASVAYHLAERGCANVVIVESAREQGTGSTGRATGGVRAQFSTAVNIAMSLYSLEFIRNFRDATGRDAGYLPVGYLFVATDGAQLEALKIARERQRAAGLTDVELLDAAEVARRAPRLRAETVAGGTFRQADGFVAPLELMRGFTERALARGARLLTDAEVTGIDVEGGRVCGVRTSRGRVATRAVVNAAGAWAARVARLAGVEIPVVPLRRQIVCVRPREPLAEGSPMVIDLSDGFHFRAVVRDRTWQPEVLLAWPGPPEPPGFNTELDPAFVTKILTRAEASVPSFAGAGVVPELSRAGLYEMTPDHHPIVCESERARGLFLACGFSGHGVMHSPAAGRAVADLILDGRTEAFDISPLDAGRFARGELIEETALL